MACKMRLHGYMCFRSYQFHYNAAVSGRKKSQRYKNLSVKIKERLWIKVKTVDILKKCPSFVDKQLKGKKKHPLDYIFLRGVNTKGGTKGGRRDQ